MNKIITLFTALLIACSVNAQPPNVPTESGATFGQKTTAEDAKKSKEEIDAITEPKKEIIVSAKGVLVL